MTQLPSHLISGVALIVLLATVGYTVFVFQSGDDMRSGDTSTQSDISVVSEIADGSQTPTAIMDAITPSPEDGLISLSEFQRIETGMTYREVTRIIGGAGRVFTETTSGGYTMSVYTYAGEGAPSANANVTFVNGKVITKIQYGLQ